MEKYTDLAIDDILEILDGTEFDTDVKKQIKKGFERILDEYLTEKIKNRLHVIYEYEKHYLELIKEYKEEIKFTNSIQEDLRRERSQFFSQSLKEVTESLKGAQVDSKVASIWIEELVKSYTKSLDMSDTISSIQVMDTLSRLREDSKVEINSLHSNE